MSGTRSFPIVSNNLSQKVDFHCPLISLNFTISLVWQNFESICLILLQLTQNNCLVTLKGDQSMLVCESQKTLHVYCCRHLENKKFHA